MCVVLNGLEIPRNVPRKIIQPSWSLQYGDRKSVYICNFIRPCLQGGRVTLARGLKDSQGLQAKFTGRVTLLPETTLRLLRFGNLASKGRIDDKTGK